jgi:uncharacterized protein (TIGR04552 family)
VRELDQHGEQVVEDSAALSKLAGQLQQDIGIEDNSPQGMTTAEIRLNEFSGPGYRVINFVTDMPVRVDDFVCRVSDPGNTEFGPIAFVLTEFQIVDAKTAHDNEVGENSHDKYKERQHARVKSRLLRGLPKDRPGSNGHDD